MFCTACGTKVAMGNPQLSTGSASQTSTALLPGRTFTIYLIKRHPIRCLALSCLAMISALVLGLGAGSVGENILRTLRDSGDASQFLSLWFWGAVPVAIGFLALPFLAASLFVQWNSQQNQETLARTFMNRQLLIAGLWAGLICVQTASGWQELLK